MSKRSALIVFARAPSAGGIKTRLLPALQEADVLALYQDLLRHTLAVARRSSVEDIYIYATPGVDDPHLKALAEEFGTGLRRQTGSDLGERMAHAFEEGFLGHERVLIIGCDCPGLEPGDIDAAVAGLSTGAGAVVGPAEDGGYYLIGLARFSRVLFEDMPWGSARVLERTLDWLRRLDFQTRILPTRWDIDRPADVARYRQWLARRAAPDQ